MATELANIMVVEDNPYDAEFILQGFRQHNPLLRARILTDGDEAVEHISAVCADRFSKSFLRLILLDLKLPKVHGLEVFRRLREGETTKDVPIVIFTSSSDERDRIESEKRGANAFIVKPVGFNDFMNTLGEIYVTWLEARQDS
jgi:DNA-binding response OmpR family regulator